MHGELVVTLEPPAGIGEDAILEGANRNASIIADSSQCRLLYITKEHYELTIQRRYVPLVSICVCFLYMFTCIYMYM